MKNNKSKHRKVYSESNYVPSIELEHAIINRRIKRVRNTIDGLQRQLDKSQLSKALLWKPQI